VLQAGPCVVVQRRTKTKDGYDAVQLGLVEFIKPQRVNKARPDISRRPMWRRCAMWRSALDDSKDETKSGDRVLVESFKVASWWT
jgi:large subunit ribosomal protein L3